MPNLIDRITALFKRQTTPAPVVTTRVDLAPARDPLDLSRQFRADRDRRATFEAASVRQTKAGGGTRRFEAAS